MLSVGFFFECNPSIYQYDLLNTKRIVFLAIMEEEKKPVQAPSTPKASAPPQVYKVGDTYEVPPEGSLGLLALGYRGLEAWRKAQQKVTIEKSAETTTTENKKTTNDVNQ